MRAGLNRLITILAALALAGAACSDDPSDNNGNPNNDADAISDDVGDDAGQPDGGDGGETDGGDTGDTDPPGENLVVCENSLPAPSDGNACSTTAGSTDLVMLQGQVLAGDTIYENGQVLIDRSSENATIACVGCDCGTEAGADTATVVSCPSSVITPGLINAHEHLGWGARSPKSHGDERYDHRHDWRRGKRGHNEISSGGGDYSAEAVLFGELRHLMGGATSIAGSGGAGGFLRNLDQTNNSEGLSVRVDYETFPLGDTSGTLIADGCGYSNIPSDSVLNDDIYLPHVSEGIDDEAQNEFACLSSASGGGSDVIADNTSVIHGIGLTAADIAEFAASGADLVWSPRTNIDLYGNTADVVTYNNYGVNIALGTDWVLSGSMNMLRELACVDYLNQNHYDGYFSDFQIWQMVTANGATALGVGDQLGTIAEGYIADISIIDASDVSGYRAVINAGAGDVQLVMRGGDALVGLTNVVEALVPAEEAAQCETISVCDGDRLICAERDTGHSWSAILGAANGNYDPFYCAEPADEPSCVPMRPDEYTGMSSADDQDGDGVADAEDTCPAVFNPQRPLDGNTQADFDGDGIGDPCDTCPLTEGETCDAFDPTDRDADDIPNEQDNCPAIANPDQTDGDSDDIGDVCDACADFANPGHTGCPSTIEDIRAGNVELGQKLLLQDVIVTAVNDGTAIFVQHQTDPYGIYVYMPDQSTFPARGDIIDLSASLGEFRGDLQLVSPDMLTVESSGNDLPDPVVVDTADVASGGAQATDLQGVLIRVDNVEVTSVTSEDQFTLDGGLVVYDLMHDIEPEPEVGDTFNALIGPLHAYNGTPQLAVRDENDIITGPAGLVELAPSTAYLEANATNEVPVPGLRLQLNRAPDQVTTVDLSYTGSVTGPATVDIPTTEDFADLSLTATGAAGTTGEITATLDGVSFTTTIELYDDASQREVDLLAPANQTVQLNQTATLTITLNLPAPTGGQDVAIATSGEVTAPGTVTVPAGALSTDFNATASGTAGQGSVTASIGTSSQTADITVTAGPSTPCLIISEYIEGSGYDNKAIELYNCGTTDLNLSGFGMCKVTNANTTCGNDLILTGTLAPGSVHTLCKTTSVRTATDPLPDIIANCDTEDSGLINHSGNDRYVVFQDDNASGAFDPGSDTVTDAFGETTVEPASDAWKDHTYRRCDFTPYYGDTAFTVLDLYEEFGQNDASDFGTPPTAGCP